jgi:hypothetical protein
MPRPLTGRLALGGMRTLAALLMADGRLLSEAVLGRIALPWGSTGHTVRNFWMPSIRLAGCQVETVFPFGYRLVALPPDELLEDVLAIARVLQQEHPTRLWELFGRGVTTETRPSQIHADRWSA